MMGSRAVKVTLVCVIAIAASAAAVGAFIVYDNVRKADQKQAAQKALVSYYKDTVAIQGKAQAELVVASARESTLGLFYTKRWKPTLVGATRMYEAGYRHWASKFAAIEPPNAVAAAHDAYVKALRRAQTMCARTCRECKGCADNYAELMALDTKFNKMMRRSDRIESTARKEWRRVVLNEARRLGMEVSDS